MTIRDVETDSDWWAPWQGEECARRWVGRIPLLLSLPHDGSELPPELVPRLSPWAQQAPDTDWFVSRLYDFARDMGAWILRPRWSRYVVDLNRPADGSSLYPGRRETGLCPLIDFRGEPIYLEGREPESAEIALRVDRYWRPYHTSLATTLKTLVAEHGQALLWEGHSIVSTCPLFFEGRLPDYNLGTADGTTCAPGIEAALRAGLESEGVSHVLNGRFRGGHITRHYGRPEQGVHAVQMEMAQACYMREAAPWQWQAELAATAQALLGRLLPSALRAMQELPASA